MSPQTARAFKHFPSSSEDLFRTEVCETIHTENSLKYGPREARTLLRAGGWSPIAEWTDHEGLFALFLASSPSPSALPW
jgi:L-histidine Nalpha-methyltransferase